MKSILTFLLIFPAFVFADCLPMNGHANYNYAPDGKSGAAAMSGDFAGGVYFKQTSDFVADGNKSSATFEHMFVTHDGSTIFTADKSWGIVVPDTPYIVGGADYTVTSATGKYEGYSGTFRSWGTFAPSLGKAVLRYEGEVCK